MLKPCLLETSPSFAPLSNETTLILFCSETVRLMQGKNEPTENRNGETFGSLLDCFPVLIRFRGSATNRNNLKGGEKGWGLVLPRPPSPWKQRKKQFRFISGVGGSQPKEQQGDSSGGS